MIIVELVNMKKINEKQRAVIKFFRKQLSWWEDTSDIDSLSHYTDIAEELGMLYDTALTNPDEYDRIESVARILYQTIKNLKDES